MRYILLAILIPVFNLSLAQQWSTIDDPGYSIEYPTSWELNQSGIMGASFLLFSPFESEDDIFRENLNLVEQDLTGLDLDLERYTELSISQLKKSIANFKIRVSKPEGNYHWLVFDGDQGEVKLTFEQYYWVIDTKAYVLTFTTERDQYDNYKQVGKRMLKSFKLK